MKFDDKYDIARPYTACFVILKQGSKVAMVLRKNTGYMDGYYGLPAGKGEWHENFKQIAVREAEEEAGVEIDADELEFVHLVHRRAKDSTKFMDWVDVYFEAKQWRGEPHNAEPEKSEKLVWLELSSLPDNVVPPQKAALEAIEASQNYSEFGWN